MAQSLPYFHKDWKYLTEFGENPFLEQNGWLIVTIDSYAARPTTPIELGYPYKTTLGSLWLYVVALDTYIIYDAFVDTTANTVTYSSIPNGGISAIATDPIYETPKYEILKD
jgi:hypothetical protein